MREIYFAEELFENVLQIIRESYDCVDVANDLENIQNTIRYGSDLEAARLDDYMRRKYPIIDTMINTANSIQARSYFGNYGNPGNSSLSLYKSRLEQDRCGILCQTAIEKGLKQNLKSCIDHVEA